MRTASSGRARRSRPAVVALLSALLLAVPLTAAADEGGSDADDPVGGAEQAAPETGAPLGVYDCNWEVYADLTLNSDVTCDGGDDYWVLVASSGVVIDLNGHTVDLGGSDWSSTGAGLVLDADEAVGGTLEDVTIRNGTIRGVANSVAVYLGSADFVRLENVTLAGTDSDDGESYGIFVEGTIDGLILDGVDVSGFNDDNVRFDGQSSNVTILDSVFTGSQSGSGIYFREPTYGLRIENSRTSNNDDHGIHANVGSDMTMLGHVAEANGSSGARLLGRTDAASLVVRNSRASSNDDGFYLEYWGSVEFRDSIAEDNSDSGFEFYYIDTLNMLDNVAEGNGYGFYGYYDYDEDYTNGDGAWTFLRNRIVGNSRGFYAGYIGRMTVRDSSAMDNSQYGFDIEEVYGPMALTGNVASGTDGIGDGFLVTDLPGPLTMRNNRAEDNLGDGFFLNDVDSGLIERNVASSNGSEGFTLDDVDDTRVFRNQATSNSGEGFSLDDIDDSVYARNRSFDNGGDGFYITYTYDTRFERNSAIDNGGDGFESDDDNDNSENLVFRNNEARLNSGDGFNLEDVDVLLAVRNNRAVANGDDGFDFDYLEDLSVTRNLARLNGDDGFYFDTDIDDFVAVAGNRALANFAWGMYHDDGYLIGRRNTAKDNGIGGCYDVDCGRRQTVRP